ncbi:MAG: antibiotic biosynthesis monooxygenase [Actinomycetota bacterium]|nr:antibiotic biosynthesis monooxygenase [Actinomycetota bacterium]
MILICRFAVNPARADDFLSRARRALGLLTAQPGCQGGQLGRSQTHHPVGGGRAVRVGGRVPSRAIGVRGTRARGSLLSEALTGEPGSDDVLAAAEGGVVTEHGSLLAVDAERGFGSGDR